VGYKEEEREMHITFNPTVIKLATKPGEELGVYIAILDT